jgi:hypothetical protein
MGYFGGYEFLVYVVPGGLLLFFVTAMFPAIRKLFGQEPVNVGGLVFFLVIAFVLGQLIQSLASYSIEPMMMKYNLAYRTSAVLFKDSTVISTEDRKRLIDFLSNDFGVAKEDLDHKSTDKVDESLSKYWRGLIGRLRTKDIHDKLTDRLDVYGQNYALNMSLAASFSLMFVLLLVILVAKPATRKALGITSLAMPLKVVLLIGIPIAVAISLERMSTFDQLFARELFGSYLQSKPLVP